jgi:signal recognition particle subunit SRP54
MGGMPGGLGGIGRGGPDLSALGAGKAPPKEDVDFEALERAMKGLGPTPPGMGGLPGFRKKN